MRKFNTPREDRITRVVLADENHRINRRAMLFSMIDELMRAKVGDELLIV